MSDKHRDFDDSFEEDVEPPAFCPAALGLHRVGTALPTREKVERPIQVLNARGMPARIRKKNKLFFDDDIVNDTKTVRQSPTKKPAPVTKPTPIKTPIKIPIASPSKHLKKRKGIVSKYLKSPSSASKPSIMANLKKTPKVKVEIASPVQPSSSTKPTTSATKNTAPKPSASNDTASNTPAAPAVPSSPSSSTTTTISAVDRAISQRIGLGLRNLLKLPKAHKWVGYEWFYSYIDRPLLLGENDFQICLRESFPQLKTQQLTRGEWSKVRRLMGKPRRCSQSFFEEERRELERRRQKIRLLQSRKSGDISFVRDLPKEIPLSLPIGTKVTARLRYPQDGLFTGTIEAIYSMSSEYRVTFDRTGLGTHSVPDYEIHVNDVVDTIPVSNITQNFRHKINGLCYVPSPMAAAAKLNRSDPLIGSSAGGVAGGEPAGKQKTYVFPKESIGGFQLRLLELVVRARKTLAAKQMKLSRLKSMNQEAETYKSYNEPFPDDYQQRYASIVISMEKLNVENLKYLTEIQTFTRDLAKDSRTVAMLEPSYLREKCREHGRDTVQKNMQSSSVDNDNTMNLIHDLSMIMYVASHLADQNFHISKVLEGVLEETKNKLDRDNVDAFQTNVHAHIRHLEKSLLQH